MTAPAFDHVPRLLRDRHISDARQLAVTLTDDVIIIAQRRPETADSQLYRALNDPTNRKELRGIPLCGTGGLDDRRDPMLVVLSRTRGRPAA